MSGQNQFMNPANATQNTNANPGNNAFEQFHGNASRPFQPSMAGQGQQQSSNFSASAPPMPYNPSQKQQP